MKAQTTRLAMILAGGLLVLAVACDESETVAPDGSTIVLAANPATIVLSDGIQSGDVNILATVRNSIGVPLPGQDVRFTNSSGFLTPVAGTPVETDDLGNALTILEGATQNTTITAQSGKATAMLSLQSVTCNISSINLSLGAISFDDCDDDEVELTATVTSTSNQPCVGVQVEFSSTVDPADLPAGDIVILFNPGSRTTDDMGRATTTVSLAEDCDEKCIMKECNTSGQQIVASAGTVDSSLVDVRDDIP